jgi:excisionase family DNA binding protein
MIKVSDSENVTADSSGYIDTREIAKRLGKTERTVQAYCRRRLIPFVKLGRAVMFDWPSVKQHIAERFTVRAKTN